MHKMYFYYFEKDVHAQNMATYKESSNGQMLYFLCLPLRINLLHYGALPCFYNKTYKSHYNVKS